MLTKAKVAISQGGYVPLPHKVLRSESFKKLSAYAVKLLADLMAQYRGSNNGDLQAVFSLMKERGWKSKQTLAKSIKELLDAGFIEISRQGGRNKCSLYALTFIQIHYCAGKLDTRSTDYPTENWVKNEPVIDIKAAQKMKLEKDKQQILKDVLKLNRQQIKMESLN